MDPGPGAVLLGIDSKSAVSIIRVAALTEVLQQSIELRGGTEVVASQRDRRRRRRRGVVLGRFRFVSDNLE